MLYTNHCYIRSLIYSLFPYLLLLLSESYNDEYCKNSSNTYCYKHRKLLLLFIQYSSLSNLDNKSYYHGNSEEENNNQYVIQKRIQAWTLKKEIKNFVSKK